MTSLHFTIWVTSACNLRCKYCYEGIEKENQFLSVENSDEILSFIGEICRKSNCKQCRISFHGGEPSLNVPAIKYIISSFEQKSGVECCQYEMTTNGYQLSEDTIQFFAENIHDLTVSIDGTQRSHNSNRLNASGNGSFQEVFRNAEKILKLRNQLGRKLRVRMTLNADNYQYLYESVVFLIEHGFKEIVPGVDYGEKRWTESHFDEIYKQYQQIRAYLEEHAPDAYVSSMSREEISKKSFCDGCRSSFHLSPDGKIYPCIYVVNDPVYCMGDVRTGLDKEKLYSFDKINAEPVPECADCGFYDYCPTKRCKYINQKLTGDYLKPSPIVCASERLLLKMAGII